jgi:hypothetical protein
MALQLQTVHCRHIEDLPHIESYPLKTNPLVRYNRAYMVRRPEPDVGGDEPRTVGTIEMPTGSVMRESTRSRLCSVTAPLRALPAEKD